MTYKFAVKTKKPLNKKHSKLAEQKLPKEDKLFVSVFKTPTKRDALVLAQEVLDCPLKEVEEQVYRYEPNAPRMVNLTPHTATALKAFKNDISQKLSTNVSYSDAIAYLLEL